MRTPEGHRDTDGSLDIEIPVADLRSLARALLRDPDEDSRDIRAGTLLLAAAVVCGPSIQRLRAYTRIPMSDINRCSYRLREARIWQGQRQAAKVHSPWLDSDDGVVEFTLHVLVATGAVDFQWPNRFRMRMVGQMTWVDFIRGLKRPVNKSIEWKMPCLA